MPGQSTCHLEAYWCASRLDNEYVQASWFKHDQELHKLLCGIEKDYDTAHSNLDLLTQDWRLIKAAYILSKSYKWNVEFTQHGSDAVHKADTGTLREVLRRCFLEMARNTVESFVPVESMKMEKIELAPVNLKVVDDDLRFDILTSLPRKPVV